MMAQIEAETCNCCRLLMMLVHDGVSNKYTGWPFRWLEALDRKSTFTLRHLRPWDDVPQLDKFFLMFQGNLVVSKRQEPITQ
jgi:hypothetical protein